MPRTCCRRPSFAPTRIWPATCRDGDSPRGSSRSPGEPASTMAGNSLVRQRSRPTGVVSIACRAPARTKPWPARKTERLWSAAAGSVRQVDRRLAVLRGGSPRGSPPCWSVPGWRSDHALSLAQRLLPLFEALQSRRVGPCPQSPGWKPMPESSATVQVGPPTAPRGEVLTVSQSYVRLAHVGRDARSTRLAPRRSAASRAAYWAARRLMLRWRPACCMHSDGWRAMSLL